MLLEPFPQGIGLEREAAGEFYFACFDDGVPKMPFDEDRDAIGAIYPIVKLVAGARVGFRTALISLMFRYADQGHLQLEELHRILADSLPM